MRALHLQRIMPEPGPQGAMMASVNIPSVAAGLEEALPTKVHALPFRCYFEREEASARVCASYTI